MFTNLKCPNLHILPAFLPATSEPTTPSSPVPPVLSYHENFVQLEPALDLLIQTMGDNLEDRPSWQFSRSVADITLDFLYTLLHRAIELSAAEKLTGKGQDFQVAIDRILYFVGKVRLCVRRINEVSVMKKPTDVLEQNQKEGKDQTLFSTAEPEVWACVVGSMKGNLSCCILYLCILCCLNEL